MALSIIRIALLALAACAGASVAAGAGPAARTPRAPRAARATAPVTRDSVRALFELERHAEAESLARAMVLEHEAGPDSLELALSLDLLAEALFHSGKAGEAGARGVAERAVAIKMAALGADHAEVAVSFNRLADLLRASGDQGGARAALERALAIREGALGPEDPLVVRSLTNLAGQLERMGEFDGAKPLLERALSVQVGRFGPEHLEVAGVLDKLGALQVNSGYPAKAREHFERALAIREKVLGPDDPDVALSLNNLAVACGEDVAAQRRCLERALAIWEKALGPDHPHVAYALNNLATLLEGIADPGAARPLYERALAIRERALGPDDPNIALSLENLAGLLTSSGEHAEAKDMLERAVGIWERARGKDSGDLAWCLVHYADLLAVMGDSTGARQSYQRALAIQETTGGPDHPDIGRTLTNLASVVYRAGDRTEARRLYQRALRVFETSRGADHPNVADVLSILAGIDSDAGEPELALREALRAEAINWEYFDLTARDLAEREAILYAAFRRPSLDKALALAARQPGAGAQDVARVYDALIRSRARVLDEMAARRRSVVAAADAELEGLESAFGRARKRLADLWVRGPSEFPGRDFGAMLDSARKESEAAERRLAGRSGTFRRESRRRKAGWLDVRAAMPVSSALVSFARYEGRGARATGPRPAGYVAFILRSPDGRPLVVDLGDGAEIDSMVGRWRAEIGRPRGDADAGDWERSYRRAGATLRERIWDPISRHVRSARLVFVVPDAALNLVSLAPLPLGSARYLVERAPTIHYLGAERDLVSPDSLPVSGRGLLALGDPDYDMIAPAPLGAGASAGDTRSARARGGVRSACEEFRQVIWRRLPATATETRAIDSLWRRTNLLWPPGQEPEPAVQRLTGESAREDTFKLRAPGHRVLHLATHGFFLGGRCGSLLEGVPETGEAGAGRRRAARTGENPLLLSGLVLAGANRRESADPAAEDGILTAEEIASLDLSGVEWAVLSACETGMGEVRAGEGVLGLRRAFQVAGARSVVMSLWSVEDEAASHWMRALYEHRLVAGRSTADAARRACLQLLRQRRKLGEDTHPSHWAAFTAAGDWR